MAPEGIMVVVVVVVGPGVARKCLTDFDHRGMAALSHIVAPVTEM